MTRRRAVVCITEGAEPALLDRWGPELLPAFHRLRRDGAYGTMRGEHVPYEPSGLLSAFTGYGPSEHGCFSYWDVHSPDYEPVVLDSGSPRRELLWHRPELADRTVAVVNVFGTHPVRPVNGYCIAYPMRSSMHVCHPRTLPVTLSKAGIPTIHDVTVWFTGGDREEFVPKVLAADAARADAALHLFDGGAGQAPDLTVLNLTAIDRLSHVYWQELEEGSPVPEHERAVLRAYQQTDAVLGRLLDRVDEHTDVLAFSEIGFGPLRAYCSVNDVLAAAGLLAYDPAGRPDWRRTRAFESVQGSQGVNVNLIGRYKHGTVPSADRERVLDEVRTALLAHINPLTGGPLFADVLRREDLHPGPAMEAAPDLILEPYDWRYLPLGDTFWSAKVNRRLQSAWHRRDSYWGGVGPSFSAGTGQPAVTVDVAPTVVRMLGLPALDELPGRCLASS
ncbi:alkaline phosphatase family protein [Micromonospora sp. NPDC047134]|uniref:alkaline phosphatase family protein n=1 Tax=Micromonospora sp. NPDC047134 TaxID=3154340 RepID=UPI00340F6FF4